MARVPVVAYSPLSRSLLSGQFKGPEGFGVGDVRKLIPKYPEDNFPRISRLGAVHGATAGQVALDWLLAQGHGWDS